MRQSTEKMTAAEARQFSSFSVGNAALVMSALECGCEPYRDVFTYNRWKAQGYQVQKGEKAIRLPLVKTVEHENEETGKLESRRIVGRSAVFCRCQVKPIGAHS